MKGKVSSRYEAGSQLLVFHIETSDHTRRVLIPTRDHSEPVRNQ